MESASSQPRAFLFTDFRQSEISSPVLASPFFSTLRPAASVVAEPVVEAEIQVPEITVAPHLYSEQEYQEAVEHSFKRGHDQGVAEGQEKGLVEGRGENQRVLQQLTLQLTDIIARVEALRTEQQQNQTALQAQASQLALLVAKKIAGAALTDGYADMVASLVAQAMPLVMPSTAIAVRARPEVEKIVVPMLQPVFAKAGFTGEVVMVADDTLAEGDCRVEWQHGGMESGIAEKWRAIDALLQQPIRTNAVEASPHDNSLETVADQAIVVEDQQTQT